MDSSCNGGFVVGNVVEKCVADISNFVVIVVGKCLVDFIVDSCVIEVGIWVLIVGCCVAGIVLVVDGVRKCMVNVIGNFLVIAVGKYLVDAVIGSCVVKVGS